MRAGMVVTQRINPRDCQSILDLMEVVGIPTKGQSFSQLASLALSSLLETQRQAGHLPEPDEFQYLNRMGGFKGRKQNGIKSKITEHVYMQGPKVRAPAMPRDEAESSAISSPATRGLKGATVEVTADQREAGARLAELLKKQELSETMEGVVWSASDQREYEEMYAIVYPEG